MFGLKCTLRALVPLAVVGGALFVASCGGNNNSTPSTSPTAGPTAGYSVTLTAANGTIPLPAPSGGNYATLTYVAPISTSTSSPSPFPTSGVTLATTSSSTAPANAPVPTSVKRLPLSRSNATVVLYVAYSLATPLPYSIFPSETLTLGPTTPTNVPYFVEIDDLTTGAYINTYPGAAYANGQIAFTNNGGFVPALNLASSTTNYSTDTYVMQFYYLGTGTPPSPTPTPSTSPLPTPTPVVVATTVPFGASQVLSLPVTTGGFVGTVTLGAAGSNATSLTTTAVSGLPAGVSGVGAPNSSYPFYGLTFTATGSVATPSSPAITVQLPTSFRPNTQLLAALCTSSAACPGEVKTPVQSKDANGVVTVALAAGQFTTFTGFSTTPEYVIFYADRTAPAGTTASGTIPAGGTTTFNVPGITPNSGIVNQGPLTSVVTLGSPATTTATINAQTGLPTGISTIIPNTQTVFYSLGITASPAITYASNALSCGTAPCVVLTLPSQSTSAAPTASYFVEQCSASACPAAGTTPAQLTLNGSAAAGGTLSVTPAQAGSVAGLGATPLYLVFYYQ